MKSKRLLHICSYSWETGGPASFIFNHAKFQVQKGIQVDIASAMYPWQKRYDVPVGVGLFEFEKSFFSRFISEFSWSLIAWYLKNRNKYEVIHLHGLWHFGAILPFIIPSKAQKIITIHGFLDEYALKKSGILKRIFWHLFQKRFLAKANKLHAMNEEEYSYLCKLFPEKKHSITLIGNGIEDPLQKDFGIPDSAFVYRIEQFTEGADVTILFLSRKSAKKGLDILLSSYVEMSNRHTCKVRLLIAGPDDDYSPSLKSFLLNYSEEDILELPLVSGAEKDYLYKKCNMVVLPSYSEGFSIAALEAMAYGKFAIFSNKIGFAKELEKSGAAIIIEPKREQLLQAFEVYTCQKIGKEFFQENARKIYLNNYQSLYISNKLFEFIFM